LSPGGEGDKPKEVNLFMNVTWEKPLPLEVVIDWLISEIVTDLRKGEVNQTQTDPKAV
jgi:hypothetical protein